MEKINSAIILKKMHIDRKYIQWYCDNIEDIKNNIETEEFGGYILIEKPSLSDLNNFKNIKLIPPCFKKYVKEEEEYLNFLNCPDVEEGIYECGKCKSKKIYKFSKQTRAGDEATTVFAICTFCKNKWVIN